MLAIIGGTGLSQIQGLKSAGFKRVATPYSEKRISIELCQHADQTVGSPGTELEFAL